MSIRRSSTDKAPKPKKGKKTKKGESTPDITGSLAFEGSVDGRMNVPRVRTKSPKAPKDVYTLVLLLSFLFFIIAIVFLYMDLASYK